MTDHERDRLILATARCVHWLLRRSRVNSDEYQELTDALEKFPLVMEEPRR
jgi:hypothetical protein